MDGAQTALTVLVSTACHTLATAAPALHITAFTEAEIAELMEDLNAAGDALAAVASLVVQHQENQEALQANRES